MRTVHKAIEGGKPVGGPFTLVDHDGIECSLADFRGKLIVLYFGCTSCSEACPIDLFHIAEAIRGLGTFGEQIQPLFITIDPERDTPWQLSCYVPYFHRRFVGLTGSLDEIRDIADRYDVHFAKIALSGTSRYAMDHDAGIFLLDREGKVIDSVASGTRAGPLTDLFRTHLG